MARRAGRTGRLRGRSGEDDAYAYYLDVGASDYYNIGERQLRLHADANGILQSIFVTQ